MRVFVAGAGGAVGRTLLPALVAAGHSVVGMTRSEANAAKVRRLGAEPVIGDLLDPEVVLSAVKAASPDAIVHEATALASFEDFRKFESAFEATNRLRTLGTDNLIAAARRVGVSKFVAQSYAGWPYARQGGLIKTEADSLDPDPAKPFVKTLQAIRHLETVVTCTDGIDGIALRYGNLYGPGTSVAKGTSIYEAVRKGKFPIVGDGAGIWSFLHIDDAATSVVAALARNEPGIYNIVDDMPAPVVEWLPYLANAIGGKPPGHAPAWLARFFVGEAGVIMMTEIRGASNAKAIQSLRWQPKWPTWRDGFKNGLG